MSLFDAALDGAWRPLINRINLIDIVEEDHAGAFVANRVLRLHLAHGCLAASQEALSVRVGEVLERLRLTHALAIVLEGDLGGF